MLESILFTENFLVLYMSDPNRYLAESISLFKDGLGNALGRIRTCDPRFRRPMLYPAELRVQSGERGIRTPEAVTRLLP